MDGWTNGSVPRLAVTKEEGLSFNVYYYLILVV